MSVLVTGAAGFIGYHVSEALLARGDEVVGLDSLNAYYDPTLKQARLARLRERDGFRFVRADISDHAALDEALEPFPGIDRVVHLAAQAGVRYSLEHPFAYAQANLVGHLAMLEYCRHREGLRHFVYASSSSVYGANAKLPFAVEDRTDDPVSLYAATKKSCELMSRSYSHLYGIPATGLRFFTVYGPWGRPDMAAFLFVRAMLAGEEIRVFNHGRMKRNFSYIDDIVAGTLGALDHAPGAVDGGVAHRVYNLGNDEAVELLRFIEVLEDCVGCQARRKLEPLQPGDVPDTVADISAATRDLGYRPRTNIEDGLRAFVDWYREYYRA